jgi:hypothetical protein
LPALDEGCARQMRWIRSNINGLARLALFVLALQFTVTFGHVHLDGLTPASAHGSAFVEQGAGPLAEVRDKDHKSQGTADFDCPICALIQLASTSAPSVAPPLPIPAMVGGLALETPDELGFAASSIFAFQARGPPSV